MVKKDFKIIGVITTMVMILCCSFAFASSLYSDVAGHWAENEIDKWSDLGIIKGYDGKFRPDDNITRGEMAVIIDRVLKFVDKSENTFTDLKQDFYTDAILKANYTGVILGDGENVRPLDNITRQEAVVMLARALSIEENAGNNTKFIDAEDISDWAELLVFQMEEKQYIQGTPDKKFNPKSNITRAEVVKILDNAITKIYSEEGTYTEDVEGIVIINTPDVRLKGITVDGDVIIAEGVGDNEVYLEDVTVKGNVYARGGGENSVYLLGTSNVQNIIISKSSTGGIRISVDNGCTVRDITVDKGENIILTGNLGNVTLNVDVSIDFVDAKIDNLNVKSDDAKINIDEKSAVKDVVIDNKVDLDIKGSVENLQINKDASETQINISDKGNIDTFVTDAKVNVNNNGQITNATVNANDVVISGNKPKTVKVDKTVDVKPVDSEGTQVPTTPTTKPSSGGSNRPSIPTINVSTELTKKTNDLFTNFYNKPNETSLNPTDEQYYIQVASGITTTPTSIKIGEEVFTTVDVSVSMGNNNFIKLPAWKLDTNKNLLIAIPVLALEASPNGTVEIDLGNDNSVEITVTVSETGNTLSVVSATDLFKIPAGYTNSVKIESGIVKQTINYGTGALGILLSDGADYITNIQKVFTKKVYKDQDDNRTSLSYGVTETEGTASATIGLYSAGWNDEPFVQARIIKIDYKVAVVGAGAVNIPIEVNITVKE